MPKAIYDHIYRDLKEKIETEVFAYQELLPSEHTLIQEYGCSRNTVRRALSELASDGYVQPMQGKGVRNIYQPAFQTAFTVGGIESFKETSERNNFSYATEVAALSNVVADEHIARLTGYAQGDELIYIERVRRLNGTAAILDRSYFLKGIVGDLTAEIAERSIYDHLEQDLGIIVAMGKRTITVEPVEKRDAELLDLEGIDYVAVMTTQAFNAQGIMFEYTQSRHRPDMFCFRDTAVRERCR